MGHTTRSSHKRCRQPFRRVSLLAFSFYLLVSLASCDSKEPAPEPFNLNGTCWTDGYEFFVGQPDTITNDS
ncbi:MAG: hypothetical protein J6W95_04915, partial [Bacteroidales bacterium]|nr:hypothetical protein [Bacteroidales bacterium]